MALAFRNGPIESVHAGKDCPTCHAAPEYSRITDDEIKTIMQSAVTRLYRLLRLKTTDPAGYESRFPLAHVMLPNGTNPKNSARRSASDAYLPDALV